MALVGLGNMGSLDGGYFIAGPCRGLLTAAASPGGHHGQQGRCLLAPAGSSEPSMRCRKEEIKFLEGCFKITQTGLAGGRAVFLGPGTPQHAINTCRDG